MTEQQGQPADIFVAGGTLRPDAPSYVVRPADDELFGLVLAGEYCAVLTSRQMGKSSLKVRTAQRLKEAQEKVWTAIIDLSEIGVDVTSKQWYLGLLENLKEQLRLSVDPQSWWAEHERLGQAHRFNRFLRDVVLEECAGRVVIFIDEIDTTLSLDFTDDFFSTIRAMYNARAQDPVFRRLTFVLIGVASPGDLIKDRQRTPYNIGRDVNLSDFQRDDATVLQEGLKQVHPAQGELIYDRIFHWTGGHPYLTQKLCQEVVEDATSDWDEAAVDGLIDKLFFSETGKREDNLQAVQDSISETPDKRALLKLYQRIYAGRRPVRNDDRDRVQNRLKLIGLVRPENGTLQVRNRIYRHVFDKTWINENMPTNWPLRIAVASPIAALLIVMLFVAPIYLGVSVPWAPSTPTPDTAAIQAGTLRKSFLGTASADARVTALYDLIQLGFTDMASELFFEELSQDDQIALFENVDLGQVGEQAVNAVVELVYELASPEVRLVILSKLFASPEYEAEAKRRFLGELSSTEQMDLFKSASMDKVGPHLLTVFTAVAHSVNDDVRLVAFAKLFQTEEYAAEARALFFEELKPSERMVLFIGDDLQTVGPELVTVIEAVHPYLNNTQDNNDLLDAMSTSLEGLDEPETADLSFALNQWWVSRASYDKAEYAQALDGLNNVIALNPDTVEAHFDRALVYIDLERYEEALTDLENALALDDALSRRISSTIYGNFALQSFWEAQAGSYPNLATILTALIVNTTNVLTQAIGDGETNVVYNVYDENGAVVPGCDAAFLLTQGQSSVFDPLDLPDCVYFTGSGIVSADRDIASTVTIIMTLASGELQQDKQATYIGLHESLRSPEFFLPLAERGEETLSWSVNVQNVESTQTEAKITLLERSGDVLAERTFLLAPQGVKIVNLSDIQETLAFPQGWAGAARISAAGDSQIAVTAISCRTFFCAAVIGHPAGDYRWFVPGLVRGVGADGQVDAFSEIGIMNTSETESTEVTVTFGGVEAEQTFTLAPLGSTKISTQEVEGLPPHGSAQIISESAPVVVTAQYLNVADNQGALYNGLAAAYGGSQLFFPDVSWAEERQADTIIYLQNLTEWGMTPTLRLFDWVTVGEGTGARSFEIPLEPLSAFETRGVDVGEYLAGQDNTAWEGSAVIEGDGLIIGAVIITRSNGLEQWATAYNAHWR